MKDYTKEIDQIIFDEVFKLEGIPENAGLFLINTGIPNAAERINALMQPTWYYPEKGELPETIESVWFILKGENDVLEGSYFDRDQDAFKDSERIYYQTREVLGWTYRRSPAPPTEKGEKL
jgi:hypothetical protein